jgi:GntR family transcriptional repressor for pyruvate dehydrogenase complex
MPERDLASFFNVARPTVRAATDRLAQQGIVEKIRGAGTFVVQDNQNIKRNLLFQALNKEAFTIVEYQEVRMALESRSAELAAKRATNEDIRMIKQCLEWIQKEMVEDSIKMKTDLTFHMNIAYASKNIVQINLMKTFYDVQTLAMSLAYKKVFSKLKIGQIIDQQHNAIFQAICNHDPNQARRSMEDHIRTVTEICREHNL